MKKLILLAVIAGAFTMTSCKKDRTCSCTGAVKIDFTVPKASKADAKKTCDAAQTTYSTAGATTCTLK